jgi:hypothetical protein
MLLRSCYLFKPSEGLRRQRRFRPLLEQIEERVLPGDTLGWAFLGSLLFAMDASPIAPAVGDDPLALATVSDLGAVGTSVQPRAPLSLPGPDGVRQMTPAEDAGTPSPDRQVRATDVLFAEGQPRIGVTGTLHLSSGIIRGQRGESHSRFSSDTSPADMASVGLRQRVDTGTGRTAQARPAARGPSTLPFGPGPGAPAWTTYAHDGQHTGLSGVASQSMAGIHWKTPVDLAPPYSDGDLLIHYGSPLVTAANTVVVPVKLNEFGDFQVEGRSGADGSLIWTQPTDYILPPHNWIPSFSPTLTPQNRLYFPGAGGTIYYRDNPDSPTSTTGQIAFYGIEHYTHDDYDDQVFINTPLTSDRAGNIYFGFEVTGPTPLNLQGGIARIGADGVGTWIAAADASGDAAINRVVTNSAPALSNDESALYVAVRNDYGSGYLLALDSGSLIPLTSTGLADPESGYSASLPDDGSASPTVGPDGDVYFGVLENPFGSGKGWLLHFSSDLSVQGAPGAFGWDDTASIVPATLVPSYQGTSSYLLMSKYNNYAGLGGDGVNKIAILDPNDTQTDERTGATVMKEVLTHAGVTPDPEFPQFPDAVREWCINDAAVDPFTGSVIANSEDGRVYRWDLASNSFTQVVTLAPATGEAYTPTVIGVDGTVYAINRATLFAVGS